MPFVAPCMRRPPLGAALIAAAAGCGGAGPVEAPPPASYELLTLDARPVPASLSATAGGRVIEVVGGRLRFERFDRRAGAVATAATIRITDPGVAPVTEERTGDGRATWRGDTVTVTFASGASESFALEDGGRTLRTVASSCGPNPCLSVLRINVYRRVAE